MGLKGSKGRTLKKLKTKKFKLKKLKLKYLMAALAFFFNPVYRRNRSKHLAVWKDRRKAKGGCGHCPWGGSLWRKGFPGV